MAGYGLYYALRGKNNWAQRRQDAQINLQMQKEMAAMEEQNLQQSLLAEQEIQAAFDKVRELDYLEADKEMIYNKEKQLRSNVIKQIGAYNGDLKRYMSAGGASDLKNYQRSLEDSKEVKLAKANKVEVMRFIEDSKKGDRFFNKTKLRIPKLDENNNPTGEFEESMVDMNDQLALHKQGLINTLNYAGSEKSIPVNMFSFSEHFKDAKNPTGDNRVTQSDIYNYATQMGASHEQAMYHVQQYGDMVKQGGDVWKWKSVDPEMYNLEKQYKRAQTLKAVASLNGEKGGLKQGTIIQRVNTDLDGIQAGEMRKTLPEAAQRLLEFKGFKKNSDGTYTSLQDNIQGYIYTDNNELVAPVRISGNNVVDVQPTNEIFRDPKTGHRMMKASVTLDVTGGDDQGTAVDDFWIGENIKGDVQKNVTEHGGLFGDIYKHDVYIDVEDDLRNQLYRIDLAKTVNQTYGNLAVQDDPNSLTSRSDELNYYEQILQNSPEPFK